MTPKNETKMKPNDIVPASKPSDTSRYYWCVCKECGWEGSSEFAAGGEPICDSGDYTDAVCPKCFEPFD